MAAENGLSDNRTTVHGTWSKRITFILAATGSAVGLGNIWKFPYIAGENGGGAFVLVYLLCIAIVGVPVMMAEVLLGRRGRSSPVNAMRRLTEESGVHGLWTGIGWMGAIAGLLILSYYSVIAGWALHFIVQSAGGVFTGADTAAVGQVFDDLLADPVTLLGWHTLFMVMTMVVVAKGVTRGLGRAVEILMPCLFLLLLIMVAYAVKLGNFAEGLSFLFKFDFSKLTGTSVLIAVGHAFFTLSLGMGAIMAYGAYMPDHAEVGKTVVTVAFLDTMVALIAGMAIFPLVFANGIEPGAGPGLMFVSLPLAFGQMPGGVFFGTLFFLLVSIAAWSSSISLIEPFVAWVVEKRNGSRFKASILLGAVTWLMGLLTVFSFNRMSEHKLFGLTAFDFLDFLTANLMLPLGGLFIAIFVGWIMTKEIVRSELDAEKPKMFALWYWVLRYIAPIAVLVVFAYPLYEKFFK